jgi:hypothetical protein
MALDGRITVDALFHDTDGTASLKVVSLEDSQEYTSGKVLIVTGTCGTTALTATSVSPSTYRDASGSIVSFTAVTRAAFSATPAARAWQEGSGPDAPRLFSAGGSVAVSDMNPEEDNQTDWFVQTTAGTASYTLVLYGS